MLDFNQFKVSKTNSKFLLVDEICQYYDNSIRGMMWARMKPESPLWIGEQSLREEFLQAKKNGWPKPLFLWKLKQIKIFTPKDLTNQIDKNTIN